VSLKGAPKPEGEERRLGALRALDVLDTPPEEAFDRLTRVASRILGTPIALVSLVDEDRQWFKSRVGLDATETPREHAFCAWAIHEPKVFEVADATRDPRFADNPLVVGDPGIRFYAGAPLVTDEGLLGTLCVIDRTPRELTDEQRQILEDLAGAVVEILKSRQLARVARQRTVLLAIAEELSACGHWRLDLKNDSLFWSDQTYAIHGADADSFRPCLQNAVAAYHPDDQATVAQLVQRSIDERTGFECELRLRRQDGEVRLVQTVGRTELDEPSGQVVALFGIIKDITELRAAQARLSHTEKMASVGTLAAGVAHEINNPLSYVQANALTLAEEIDYWAGASPSARLRELADMVAEIREGVTRIKRIVGGLKTFSRTSEQRIEVVELKRVLEIASRLCMNELRHKARFAIEVPDGDPPFVDADESQLVQVAVNLLVNAGQAIEGGNANDHRVTARAGRDVERVYLEIEDTGAGMSPEVLEEAFTPFFTTKPQGVGTGLGLSICHGIVHAFGGELVAESTVGEGTRIRAYLPASASRQATSSTPAPRPSSPPEEAAPRRVLIVDDEIRVGRSVARLLRGHEVDVVTDPREALGRIEAGDRWDAILCDLMMPSMSGPAFHAELEAHHPDLAARMIVITGGALTPEGRAFLEGSAVPVVDKPVDAEHLRDAVRGVLRAAPAPA
jgi:PAS domain S-box-containing protein